MRATPIPFVLATLLVTGCHVSVRDSNGPPPASTPPPEVSDAAMSDVFTSVEADARSKGIPLERSGETKVIAPDALPAELVRAYPSSAWRLKRAANGVILKRQAGAVLAFRGTAKNGEAYCGWTDAVVTQEASSEATVESRATFGPPSTKVFGSYEREGLLLFSASCQALGVP